MTTVIEILELRLQLASLQDNLKQFMSHPSKPENEENSNNLTLSFAEAVKNTMKETLNDQETRAEVIISEVKDEGKDLEFMTETWLRGNIGDNAVIAELTPSSFKVNHVPRGSRGGSVAVVSKKNLRLNNLSKLKYSSLEFKDCQLDTQPKSNTLRDLCSSFGLSHHVYGATHRHGHTLNLLFTKTPEQPEFSLCVLRPVSEDEVRTTISSSATKHSSLDPKPTWLLKQCIEPLVPLITSTINQSLSVGHVPKHSK
ncbi:hypothetical protein CAPTEDRAFT_201171 [Capitella teleta]|uniref:Uncharacterized protein n=1 Tax=Capitella teleta TaxID=283909 RepID=R7VJ50_CAPTE|nr:hypothetical protein CAPTEDRAFT_201171 [Capitella teleta]|eukprot:ELU15750.1 hypothetical protein CAPTEDRAFT_201171 [Capitella teleta]